ncbi:MAG TPA: Gldg family protein [Vicinamibacteria bacterium]|nr:Gldg family protein [Vicinamibacteria bacterium]
MAFLKRLVDYLAPAGFILAIAAVAWARITPFGKPLPGGLRPYLIAALALVLVHLVLRWEDVARGLGRRQLKYGTNTFVLVLVVLGILGLVNYLVDRHTKRFDLTKDQRYSLSDQTRKVLAGLKDDVKITYFQRQRDMERGQDRLKEYTALSPRLKVEFVDPVQSPAKAQAYDVRGPWPILVVEKGTKRERVTNDGEQDLTNALIKVNREGKKTVCLLEGEGERGGEESGDRGFSGVKSSLTKSLYETKNVFLMREKTVPADCTVLVVGGPEKDLLPETTGAIRDYVKKGGKAFVMVEPELKEHYPNLVALLKDWNIEAGQDVVVDVSGMGQLFGFSELAPLALEYPYHAITKDFRLPTLYGGARSVQAGKGTVEGVSAQDLVKTSAQSWAESDLTLKSPIKYDEGKDRKGPISLAAVATVKAPAPAPTPTPSPAPSPAPEEPKAAEGRVVAVGDVDFASNALLGFQGNQDFFLNAVAWLAEDADLISIRPKEPENQALFLSRQVQQNVAWVALVILPGLFVVLGVVTWWRRR